MTKNFFLIVIGMPVMIFPVRADDITLADGTVLKNAKIVQRDDSAKTVTISFSGGTAQVHSEMLPASPATTPTSAPQIAAAQTTPTPQPSTIETPTAPIPKDWTVNGRDYHNVGVTQVEADRVHITYDGGLGTLMLADLPPDLKKRFGYDPDAARKEQAQRDVDAQAAQQEYAAMDAAM